MDGWLTVLVRAVAPIPRCLGLGSAKSASRLYMTEDQYALHRRGRERRFVGSDDV